MYPYGPPPYPPPPPAVIHHASHSHHHVYPPYYAPAAWGMHPQPPISASVQYITVIHPEDVLSGRGGATNSHSGNRAFRNLVKQYQAKYLQAKKRDKPSVASIIVELIRKKGGRFLRRCDATDAQGQVLYVDIGDMRAREKTCQALREGAPELRKRKQHASSDDSIEAKRTESSEAKHSLSSASSAELEVQDNLVQKEIRTKMTSEDDSDFEYDKKARVGDGPIVIRPCHRLLPRQRRPLEPVPLDQLSAEDRDFYLRDFLPPCPPIRRRPRRLFPYQTIAASDRGKEEAATEGYYEPIPCAHYFNRSVGSSANHNDKNQHLPKHTQV